MRNDRRLRLPRTLHVVNHRRRPVNRHARPGPSSNSATPRLARLEAVLWLSTQPLSLRQLATAAAMAGPAEARDALDAAARRLQRRGSSLEIVSVAGGFQLLTRPQYAAWLAPAPEEPGDARLTPAALETLAIVAGRQPTVRAEVEAIRGVGCGELLRQLLEADLLRIVGRSGELGRPLVYGTTTRFLQVFGLRSLEDLEPTDQVAKASQPTRQNASLDPDNSRAA